VNPRNWIHPADIVSVNDTKYDGKESLWQNFTDGNKTEKEWGQGLQYLQGRY
jgi:hypothetical protein